MLMKVRFSEQKLLALTYNQKKFIDNMLMHVLLITDIGIVNKITIPYILNRLMVIMPDCPNIISECSAVDNLTDSEFLLVFEGLRTEIKTLSNIDYAKKKQIYNYDKLKVESHNFFNFTTSKRNGIL